MGETIRAVICLCDLRGFTALSESLSRDELIGILNLYFGAVCEAVESHKGEVLKFVGDGLLAIFPIQENDSVTACKQALCAAAAIEDKIAQVNHERETAKSAVVDYGLALHIGDVMYGNIGGENRLDFTVIGPAVNLAARIEKLCSELHQRPLLSQSFIDASDSPARCLGEFRFKGVSELQSVFALDHSRQRGGPK